MRQFLLFPVLLLFAVSVSVPTFSQSSAKHFTKTRVVELNYLLYLPPAYATDTHSTFPLILFLHGSGESGSDLNQVKNNGIPKLIAEGKDFPFVVVSPQNPSSDVSWDTKSLKMLLDEVISTYRIDTNRLYLTGLSMGGWGTWDMQFRYQDLFAAIAPVCGFFDYILEDDYKPVPVWIFHGDRKSVV